MYSNKINTILFLLFLGIVSLCATCNKQFDCSGNVYSFQMSIKAIPNLDSIHINDTLWLEVNEPTTRTEVQTGRNIDYSGALNLGSAIGFQKFSTSTDQFTIDAVQKITFFLVKGTEVASRTPNLYKVYDFAEENKRYIFKLGVIAKEIGIFRLVFSNSPGVTRVNDKCTKASFTLDFKNTDQHFYLFPGPGGNNTPPGGGSYYFKVY